MTEQIPTRHEQNTEDDHRPRWRRLGHTAARVALGVGIGAGIFAVPAAVEVHKSNQEMERQIDDARQLADRFTCNLELIEDSSEVPPADARSYSDMNSRTQVRVAVSVEEKPGAAEVRARYGNDDSVTWGKPNIIAFMEPEADPETGDARPFYEGLPVALGPIAGPPSFDEPAPLVLYPKTTYEDGQRALVAVVQETRALGDKGIHTVTGYMPCAGDMRFNAQTGAWEQAESERELEKTHITETFSEWQ